MSRNWMMMTLVLAAAGGILGHAQEVPEPPSRGVPVYFRVGDKQVVQLEQHEFKQGRDFKVSHGMAMLQLDGDRSPVRIMETRPTFLVKAAKPPDPRNLMRLDSGGGNRTARLVVQGKLAWPMTGSAVEFEVRRYGQSSYRIRPLEPLAAGEYSLSPGISNSMYFFGVEPGASDTADPEAVAPPASPPATKETDPNEARLKQLEALLTKGLIEKADYDARKEEILHPAPPKPPTIEDRLKKLDDLLKKGLIGKPEYDKKRAEILAEM
jgi:hypothetical protein